MALGVSLSVLSNLGVSPMSSIPYVMSQIVPSISMGSFTTGLFCCYVAIQAVLLGSKFHPVRLLQILGSFLFGWFVDITNWLTGLILSQPQRADLLHKGPPLFLCKKTKGPRPARGRRQYRGKNQRRRFSMLRLRKRLTTKAPRARSRPSTQKPFSSITRPSTTPMLTIPLVILATARRGIL